MQDQTDRTRAEKRPALRLLADHFGEACESRSIKRSEAPNRRGNGS